MEIPVIGFADSGMWARRGNYIIRVARNKSYAEHLLMGLPIEFFLEERPDFFEPPPRMIWRELEDSNDYTEKNVTEEVSDEDVYEDVYEEDFCIPSGRNHRRVKNCRNKKRKHEAKIQKINLLRGKVRVDESAVDILHRASWDELRDNVLDGLAYKLRFGETRYSWRDIDKMFIEFEALLDVRVHSTDKKIKNEWDRFAKENLDYYTPIREWRYFNVELPEVDDDPEFYMDITPIRLYM